VGHQDSEEKNSLLPLLPTLTAQYIQVELR